MTVYAPAITLLVITRNHERYIDRCLASVSAQTFGNFEVLITDDGSTDRTGAHIQRWLETAPVPARVCSHPVSLGICVSRNRVLPFARGEFLAALSGDDYYEPQKLERQYEFMRRQAPSVAAVFGNARVVTETEREVATWFAPQVYARHPTALMWMEMAAIRLPGVRLALRRLLVRAKRRKARRWETPGGPIERLRETSPGWPGTRC